MCMCLDYPWVMSGGPWLPIPIAFCYYYAWILLPVGLLYIYEDDELPLYPLSIYVYTNRALTCMSYLDLQWVIAGLPIPDALVAVVP